MKNWLDSWTTRQERRSQAEKDQAVEQRRLSAIRAEKQYRQAARERVAAQEARPLGYTSVLWDVDSTGVTRRTYAVNWSRLNPGDTVMIPAGTWISAFEKARVADQDLWVDEGL